MSDAAKGLWSLIGACVVWGLSGLYFKALSHVPAFEVLCHRILWSAVVFVVVLALQGRLRELWRAFRGRAGLMLGFAALVAGINWFTFIFAVQAGRAVEASLGYYIFPLLAVLFGLVFFGERLSRVQMLAVALAAIAVAVLTWGLGHVPFIALAVAFSFGLYGLSKRQVAASPVVSVTAEVVLLAPVMLIWLAGVHLALWQTGPEDGQFGRDLTTSLLLAASGPFTAVPLMMFSYAARRVRMSTVGLVQYLNPTLQFSTAVLALGEPLTPWHMIAFPLIWVALAIYSAATLRQSKVAAREASSVATSGTVAR